MKSVRKTGDAIEIGQGIKGMQRADGTLIAYDYERQAWIDTSPFARRDPHARAGSISNPLATIPSD